MTVEHDVLVRLLLAQRAMLLGYIGSIVRDVHLAEDVFQDTTLVALKKRDELADAAGFAPWARRIARLEAMNTLRRIQKAPRTLDDAVLDALEGHWDEAEAGPASAALQTCLQRLPPKSRRMVEFRYREDLSGRDLAEKMAQPLNTVYVTLARIHRALHECMRGRHA